MKKIFNILLVAIAVFATACSNEAIEIETSAGKVENAVTITVSPSKFMSSYNYVDTKHSDVKGIAEYCRTFHSEYKGFILVRSYFYDKKTGALADSACSFVKTADNDVVLNADLPVGNYYAISIISFANSNKTPFWDIANREKLETAKLVQKNSYAWGSWNIFSVSTEEIAIHNGTHASISTVPTPVGSIIYFLYQNFEYKNQSSYGTIADNGIRELAIYTRNKAVAYKLNPNAPSRYEYLKDAGTDRWYYVSQSAPADFDDGSWTYFQSDLYGYVYFLSPQASMKFGYTLDGETGFHGYGETNMAFESGKVYLAYWDYFKVGNPYFGIADNNHWNTYSTSTRSNALMKALPGNTWSK